MKTSRRLLIAGILAVAATGCSAQDAPPQQQEAAKPMPDFILQAPLQEIVGTGPAVCASAKGEWNAERQHCAMTEAMCVDSTDGSWTEGACVVAVPGEAECSGFSGMAWSGKRCEVGHITEEELVRFGF